MGNNTANIVYNEIRAFVLGSIYEIPGVGWIASGFIGVLWPEKESAPNVWDTIKSRVDTVVAEKISTEVYNRATAELTGLRDQLYAYKADPTQDTYQITLEAIRTSLPHFQEKGHETQLLPLFTQVVNIYLLFLREGLLHSEALQLVSQGRTALQDELSAQITTLSDWANTWFQKGIPPDPEEPGDGRYALPGWVKQNDYIREYTFSVLDFVVYWPTMDPSIYAPPVTNPPRLTRQIFSKPYGNGGRYFTDSVISATDLQAKDGKITHITIYGRKDWLDSRLGIEGRWIQGAQVTYGSTKASKVGSGVSSHDYGAAAARFFDDHKGRVYTEEIAVSDLNPITEVWGYGGAKEYDIIYGIGFTFKDGTKTPLIGMKTEENNRFQVGCVRQPQRRDDQDRGEGGRSGSRDTAARGMTFPAGSAGQNCCQPLSVSRERRPMTENTAKSVNNLGYHAHIYYDPTSTRAVAEGVCAALGAHCQVEIEAFRDTPSGPHPLANVLVIFTPDQFEHVVPYLMVHRAGLDVLVHPLTEDAVEDHTDFAMWLGKPVELNIHTLPHGRGGRLPSGVSA